MKGEGVQSPSTYGLAFLHCSWASALEGIPGYRQAPFRGGEVNGCSERSGDLLRLHSWAFTNLNLTGGYISEGVVPDVRLGREGPGGSQRPSSELGRVWLGPPGSTGLVRLQEEEAGLLRFSGTPADSELRLGTSERSEIRSDKACLYHLLCAQLQSSFWPLGSIMVLSQFPSSHLPVQHSPSPRHHHASVSWFMMFIPDGQGHTD